MPKLITKLLVGAALLTGGAASADTFDHRGSDRSDRSDDASTFRDHREHGRRGFVWIEGHFERKHHRRVWIPGHYERIRRDAGRY